MSEINWSKWSSIAEIVSSVSILVTLVYLGIQTNQNTQAVQSNTRNMMLTSDSTIVDQIIDHPEIEISFTAPELTLEEQIKLENFLVGLLRSREHQWFQFQSGQLDEQSWASYQSALTIILSYSRTRTWFENIHKADAFDSDFMAATARMLETVPVQTEYYNFF